MHYGRAIAIFTIIVAALSFRAASLNAGGAKEPADLTKARDALKDGERDLSALHSAAQGEDATDSDNAANDARNAADKAQQKAQDDEDAAQKAEAARANGAKSEPGQPSTDQLAARAREQADQSYKDAAEAERNARAAERKADNDSKSGPIHKKIRKQREKNRDLKRRLRDFLKKYGIVVMNVPGLPDSRTALASLVQAGKVEAVATGTGETIGNVANVSLHNKTDQPQDVTIPPTVLISTDGSTQNYGVPQPTQVALKPGETKTVPLDGVCTQAHKPPAGSDKPGNLMIADPQASGFKEKYGTQLTCTQDVIQTVTDLQEQGKIHTPFHRDLTKEFQTVVQQTIWAANPSHDGKATTKEDLANKVYEQVGAKTDEDKKKLQPGIDSIWDAVQLTGVKAKVFEIGNTPVGGGSSTTVPDLPPEPRVPGTVSKFQPPPGAKPGTDSTGADGTRTVTYDDEDGHHTVTIDKDGSWVDHFEKYEDKNHPDNNHPTATREKHFDKDGNKTGSTADRTKYDDKGDPTDEVHEDYDSKGDPTGGYKIKHEYDKIRFVKRIIIEKFDKDHRVTSRDTQEVDDRSRPVLDRHENVDPNTGKTTGGSEDSRTYDPEGHMTPTHKVLP